jgi:hypothetical protein
MRRHRMISIRSGGTQIRKKERGNSMARQPVKPLECRAKAGNFNEVL